MWLTYDIKNCSHSHPQWIVRKDALEGRPMGFAYIKTAFFFNISFITDTAKDFSWLSKKNFSINPTKHVMRISSANHTPEYPKQKWLDKMGIELKFFILNSVLCTLDSVLHDNCMPQNRSRGITYGIYPPDVNKLSAVLALSWERTGRWPIFLSQMPLKYLI